MTIVARTISSGAASGIAYGAGTVVGILIFLMLAAFGLSIIAAKMAFVMTVLWRSRLSDLDGHQALDGRAGRARAETCLRAARAIGDLCHGRRAQSRQSEMPLFYVALLPNVVGASLTSAHLGILVAVILAVEFVVIGGHVVLAGRARTLLRTPRIVRRVNRAAGSVMISAGVAVVVTR
jgi:threonine/homoserine/homoserine lactone efflux protein